MTTHYWLEMLGAYWAATATRRDFLRAMRIRLAQSRFGPVLAPRPYVTTVNVRPLGGPVTMRSHTSDVGVLEEMIATRHYSHLPLTGVRTIVDLGANIGLTARWWKTRHPEARAVCVEPEPGNVQMLRINIPDAVIIPACIGGHERLVGLSSDHGDWAWRINGDGDTPVLTMPTVLEQAGIDGTIDVLKCDIEGAEAELFDQCSGWIGRVRGLIVECHSPYTTRQLLGDLERNGAAFRQLHHERHPAYGVETITLATAVRETPSSQVGP